MDNPAHDGTWLFNYYARRIAGLFGPIAEECTHFYQVHGYFPHLKQPRTYSEKICHRKLLNAAPFSAVLADKVAVRSFVSERGYSRLLNEIFLVTEHPETIDFSALPQRFVIKATHASGWNIIVTDKNEANRRDIIEQCKTWLKTTYGSGCRERHYAGIKPQIIIEKYLHDETHDIPLDYKFFVFHGVCHFIQVDYGRFTEHTRTIYNTNWEPQNFCISYPSKIVETKPPTLNAMTKISEDLARDLDFARIDLYSVNNRQIYFGEITLTPGGGLEKFYPDPTGDYLMGALW